MNIRCFLPFSSAHLLSLQILWTDAAVAPYIFLLPPLTKKEIQGEAPGLSPKRISPLHSLFRCAGSIILRNIRRPFLRCRQHLLYFLSDRFAVSGPKSIPKNIAEQWLLKKPGLHLSGDTAGFQGRILCFGSN